MALEMKAGCEKCSHVLAEDGAAFICSYECTYCPNCATSLKHTCPNCNGELVVRPRRDAAATAASK